VALRFLLLNSDCLLKPGFYLANVTFQPFFEPRKLRPIRIKPNAKQPDLGGSHGEESKMRRGILDEVKKGTFKTESVKSVNSTGMGENN
jgi:hypothetical protein